MQADMGQTREVWTTVTVAQEDSSSPSPPPRTPNPHQATGKSPPDTARISTSLAHATTGEGLRQCEPMETVKRRSLTRQGTDGSDGHFFRLSVVLDLNWTAYTLTVYCTQNETLHAQ